MVYRRCVPLAAALSVPFALGTDGGDGPAPHAVARLVCGTSSVQAATPVELGINLKIERGWHVYWDGQNDSGFPLKVKWTLPPGVKAGDIRWPAPTRHVSPGDILDHIYEGETTLIVPFEISPEAAKAGPVAVSASLSWLVCKNVCVTEEQAATITLRIAPAEEKPAPSSDSPLFEKAHARLPRPIPATDPPASIKWTTGTVEIDARGASELLFYPGRDCVRLADPLREAQVKGPHMSLALAPSEDGKARRLRGVLEVRSLSGPSENAYYEVDVPGNP